MHPETTVVLTNLIRFRLKQQPKGVTYSLYAFMLTATPFLLKKKKISQEVGCAVGSWLWTPANEVVLLPEAPTGFWSYFWESFDNL